jgi:Pyridoxamine 5'-phosphate oxidase
VTPGELTWDEIADAFGAARNWWVSTAGPGGPHAVPVWGVVADGRLSFYGDTTTVRSRNLAGDPRLVLHLEDGNAPLIVHGRVRAPQPASVLPAVTTAYRMKYPAAGDAEYLPDDPAMGDPPVYVVDADRAVTWDATADFPDNTRRWRAQPTTCA